jgi:replicative DNA helicase
MDTTLPYDTNLEDSILGNIILSPQLHDEIAPYITDTEVFYQTKAQILWKKITKMIRSNEHVDMVTLCSSISKYEAEKGLSSYYITLCTKDVGLSGTAVLYAVKLYEKYLLRKVIVATQKIQMEARESSPEVYEVVADAHTLLGEVLNVRPSMKQDIEDVINDTVESMKQNKSKLLSTGYECLDRFAGGLTRGEITIIGGRPGHGKTTVLINIMARMLEQGKRVMFFSRELPNAELLKKIICLESQELSYGLVRKNLFTPDDLNKFNKSVEVVRKKYNKDNFLMFDNIKDFSASSAEVKKFKPDAIFDDYIQLIGYSGKEEQRRLQIEELVNNYKWLAKEANASVILASQLNRGIEYRGKTFLPQLSDLAESGAIEQVAENVFFTYYDYKVNGEDGKGKNVITMSAGKVRYGDTGTIDMGYDGDKCKIFNNEKEMTNELPFT